jgi:hypothetical protein
MASAKPTLEVGNRYLNAKNRQPLTLLYIGPLPPSSSIDPSASSGSSIVQWLGVEYTRVSKFSRLVNMEQGRLSVFEQD